MTKTINQVQLRGFIGNVSEKITTDKSSFYTMSISTKRGKNTDWHKVVIFDGEDIIHAGNFEPSVGDYVRIEGELSYRSREIKDADGKVITSVKEASVIASTIFAMEQKQA